MDFTPFNEIWYLDCFRHGIAQIAYNYHFLPQIFENDYFKYTYYKHAGKPVLNVDIKLFAPCEAVFEKNGINVSVFPSNSKTILANIKKALSCDS